MSMNDKILIDQVFYSSGSLGYGILATSLAETSFAQAVVNACLAVGQIPGAGLAKPVLLSRVLGDQIVMARLCNGVKDSSGRNTLFIHALVGTVQEVRSAHISTFSLEDAGVFCDKASEASSRPIMVDAHESVPPRAALPQVPLDFPAAIETPEPDAALMRRIVSGKENVLSWATFAYDDMPGYDVICLSTLASSPMERNIYDADLRLVRSAIGNRKVSVSAPISTRGEASGLLRKSSSSPDRPSSKKRGLLMALIVSIGVNILLLVVLCSYHGFRVTEKQSTTNAKPSTIISFSKQKLAKVNRVTDEDLKPLKDFFDLRKKDKDWEDKCVTFTKLLSYRDFFEQIILNQEKEK